MTEVLTWLIEACKILLVAVLLGGCLLLVWTMFSPFGFALKRTSEAVGLRRLAEWLQLNLPLSNPLRWFRQAFETSAAPFDPGGDSQSVKVVVDERLDHVLRTMRASVEATRKACRNLEGLGGVKGPASVVADVRALQRRTEDVAKLGGEIPEELLGDYQGRARGMSTMIVLILFAAAFAAVNGTLLNLFFRDVFPAKVAGAPASLLVSIGFIVAEMALGFGIAWFFSAGLRLIAYLLIATTIMAALFEGTIFAIVSYGFDLDIALFEQHPWLKFWMAPLGIIFVTATAVTGFIYHRTQHELDDHRGAARLKREIAAVNSFVRALPARWEAIGARSRQAEGAISSFVDALGNKAGALKGAIDAVRIEREAMTKALAAAKVDDWRRWMEGGGGDVRLGAAQNAGFALAAILFGSGFVWFFHSVLERGRSGLPDLALWAAAIVAGGSFFALGLAGFSRIQLIDDGKARVHLLRNTRRETIGIGVVAAAAVAATIWAALQAFGPRGLGQAALLLAGGGALAFVGYNLDRGVRGGGLLLRLALSTLLGVMAFIVAGLLHVGWVLWFAANLVYLVLSFLAWPFERVIQPWFERRARLRGPPPALAEAAV